jgi:hypothetical protein
VITEFGHGMSARKGLQFQANRWGEFATENFCFRPNRLTPWEMRPALNMSGEAILHIRLYGRTFKENSGRIGKVPRQLTKERGWIDAPLFNGPIRGHGDG